MRRKEKLISEVSDLECDGYGCVPADFMFVGISAGRLGALKSKVPLTKDASGRIFQRCLREIGLSESDELSENPKLTNCYITNLVKSRVLTKKGLNRLPTQREILDWFPYFEAEVQKVKPILIIALGDLVADFLRHTKYRKLLRAVKHPRWYQSHGALKSSSTTFKNMVVEYGKALKTVRTCENCCYGGYSQLKAGKSVCKNNASPKCGRVLDLSDACAWWKGEK